MPIKCVYRPVLYVTCAFLNHSPRDAANAPAVFGLHGVLGITTCRRTLYLYVPTAAAAAADGAAEAETLRYGVTTETQPRGFGVRVLHTPPKKQKTTITPTKKRTRFFSISRSKIAGPQIKSTLPNFLDTPAIGAGSRTSFGALSLFL